MVKNTKIIVFFVWILVRQNVQNRLWTKIFVFGMKNRWVQRGFWTIFCNNFAILTVLWDFNVIFFVWPNHGFVANFWSWKYCQKSFNFFSNVIQSPCKRVCLKILTSLFFYLRFVQVSTPTFWTIRVQKQRKANCVIKSTNQNERGKQVWPEL